MKKKRKDFDFFKWIFYAFIILVVIALGIFVVVFLWGDSDTRGQTNLIAVNYDSCYEPDLSDMPMYKTDKVDHPCSSWTIVKDEGYYQVKCDYEGGAWRAYGIQPIDVSGLDSVNIKADLSTSDSRVHYDDYVNMVVFTEDKSSELTTCGGSATPEGWATTCALTDLTTDSLGHCGISAYQGTASCDLTVDVSGYDTIYLTFISMDAWDLAFGVLTNTFDNIGVCTNEDQGSAAQEEDYSLSFVKDIYNENDTELELSFGFPEGIEQSLVTEVVNDDDEFVSAMSEDWNLHVYPSTSSPQAFTPPIEWTEEGYYEFNAYVVEWVNDQEVTKYTFSPLEFYYEGSGDEEEADVVDVVDDEPDSYECEVEGCEEAIECAMGLSSVEGCMMEVIDIIPVLDKSAAVSLLGDDLCSLNERYQMNDSIGMAVTSALMAIDFADNAVDFTIVGYGVTIASDIVEGAIDCAEGILYEAVKMCGGYTTCMYDVIRGIQAVTGGGVMTVRALSPVELSIVDSFGNELPNALVVNEADMKFALITDPDEKDVNVVVEGIGSGTYDLEMTVYDENGNTAASMVEEDIPIVQGQETTYEAQVSSYDSSQIIFEQISDVMPTEINFPDLENHWSKEYVVSLAEDGVIGGYSDGTFRPDQTITRAELLKISLKAFEDVILNLLGVTISEKENTFWDISSNDWFYSYVTFAAYYNMVGGYEDGSFKPNKNVTRAEALKIIFLSTGLDLSLDAPESTFSDVSNDAWYSYYIMIGANAGIVGGYSDGTFRPNNYITRAEAAKIVQIVYQMLLNSQNVGY